MKTKICLSIVFILSLYSSNAQTGLTCETSIQILPDSICNYQPFTTSDAVMWFSFVAQSNAMNASVVSEPYRENIPHIHQIILFDGPCAQPVALAYERLPISDGSDTLSINLNAGDLIIGNVYHIRVDRIPLSDSCDKINCYENNYSNAANFKLCLQSVYTITPATFQLEEPMIEHDFLANDGQLRDENDSVRTDIKFYAPNVDPKIYISNSSTSIMFSKYSESETLPDSTQNVIMTLANSITPYKVLKAEETPNLYKFFLPNINDSLRDVKSYYMIVCYNIYNGIDMVYYSNEAGLKIYYVIHQEANPLEISMNFSGAASTIADDEGGLQINSAFGVLHFETGHPWQLSEDGELMSLSWNASFNQNSASNFSLNTSTYDNTRALIIEIDQGHRSMLTPINPQCELQTGESDGFDDPTLDFVNRWSQDGYGGDQSNSLWAKMSPGCNNDDYDAGNLYSHNSNLIQGTAIIGNQTENILRLNTKYDPVTRRSDIWNCNSPSASFTYTTAIIRSQQKFKYGFFEMKAKFPGGNVNHSPAFWLWDVHNNRYSEIDMFETDPCYPPNNRLYMSLHNGPSSPLCCSCHYPFDCWPCPGCGYLYNNPCSGPNYIICPQNNITWYWWQRIHGNICPDASYTIPSDPRADFHTYGVDWQPGIIKFYVDGSLVKWYNHLELNPTPNYQCENSDFGCDFNQTISLSKMDAMHLIIWNRLNVEGPLPQQGNDHFFDIDYIKVCKVKPTIIGPRSICLNGTYNFSAFQYTAFITSDNYSWNVTGGFIAAYLNASHSQVQITVTNSTTLSITVTANENSINTSYYIPIRHSSSTKTYMVDVILSAPSSISRERWGSSCYYRAKVTMQPNVDQYYWSDDNGSTWWAGTISGSVNYFNVELMPNSDVTLKVKALNCRGYSPIRTQTIHVGPVQAGCLWRLAEDTLQSKDNSFIIYPNPSNNSFTFKLNNDDVRSSSLKIIDVLGKTVEEISDNNFKKKEIIFGSSLNPGIYFVSVNINDKNENMKIIKTK